MIYTVNPEHFADRTPDGSGTCAKCLFKFRCCHALKIIDNVMTSILDKACPNCGEASLSQWSGDPETTILGGG